jgi:hypothetical protein
MSAQKIAGIAFLLLGVAILFIRPDRVLFSAAMNLGLVMIFFAREPVDDERVKQLKMKAVFHALGAGVGLNFFVTFHHAVEVSLKPQTESLHWAFGAISPWDFLTGLLLTALISFHYWRWQDGRARTESD